MNQKHPLSFPHLLLIILWLYCLTGIAGCTDKLNPQAGSCIVCHSFTLDTAHQFSCITCHKGNDKEQSEAKAHKDMLSQPAHPDNFTTACGSCHGKETTKLQNSLHYTVSNAVNMVRSHFGAEENLLSLTDIPIAEQPKNIVELADDMLRRRCLRCHLFSPGDDYSATIHGTGCAACHLEYDNGKLSNHRFLSSPGDEQCLSCHYGNRVGFDYYGRFEHDFNTEYRTPYTVAETTPRPYGVEYHQLSADIHQQRGMVCVDCHGKDELMYSNSKGSKISCSNCHDSTLLTDTLPPDITQDQSGYLFTSKQSGKLHRLPVMKNPAHIANSSVTCQACHAQWAFNDTTTHLLRSDLDEYDAWSGLTVQGSSEVERFLEHNLDYNNEELPPAMTDKINGDMRPGVWYKGYTMRRWEDPILGRTTDGKISVMRPELNLALSYITEDEDVIFDNYTVATPLQGMVPYTPHTTGPAGIYYQQRLRNFLQREINTNP